MNRRLIDYVICKDKEDMSWYMDSELGCKNVSWQVSTLLKKGWELYGKPFISKKLIVEETMHAYIPVICQAMVLYDDSTPLEATCCIDKEKNNVG